MSEPRNDPAAAFPREHAHIGVCDVCERSGLRVVTWNSDDAPTACEECFVVMRDAWDEMTPAEQAEVLRG